MFSVIKKAMSYSISIELSVVIGGKADNREREKFELTSVINDIWIQMVLNGRIVSVRTSPLWDMS